ncbi:hypothetical protein ZWY2020_041996 [Hordeum vulgare]|nr:hypothetical protein ZWY2020_041996 [Hordeum vulgare]
MREMEALEKKGHIPLAKPMKSSYKYNTLSRHKHSKSDLEVKNAKDAPPSQKASNHPSRAKPTRESSPRVTRRTP